MTMSILIANTSSTHTAKVDVISPAINDYMPKTVEQHIINPESNKTITIWDGRYIVIKEQKDG